MPELVGVALIPLFASCAFILDFDELQKGAPDDASAGTGASGGSSGGSGGSSAGSGATAGAAGSSAGSSGSGGAAGDDGGPNGVPLTELASKLADAVCANLEACAGPAIELFLLAETCRPYLGEVFQDAYVAPISESVSSGAITYNPVTAETCVQALLSASQPETLACADFNAVLEDCKSALGGLADEGGQCRTAYECAIGLTCDASATCPGTCRRFAQLDEACRQDSECDPTLGLYCKSVALDGGDAADAGDGGVDAGGAGTCARVLTVGTPCTSEDKCAPGTMCLGAGRGDDACRSATDLFTVSEGFGCSLAAGSSMCKPGLSCEFSGLNGTCVAEKTAGGTCKFALPDACPAGYYCDHNPLNFLTPMGTCLALPTLDRPCAQYFMQQLGIGPACAAGHVCVNGLCKERKHLNETCTINEECYGGACAPVGTTNQCVPMVCQ